VCGIIGYVGPRAAKPLLIRGLERLEYRGYDSAGLALLEDGALDYVRAVGNLAKLKNAAKSNGSASSIGLGHTRWATAVSPKRTPTRSPAATGAKSPSP
jgi:glucosamine--fructose-6-phosphate aminotransferase (isomerizing)